MQYTEVYNKCSKVANIKYIYTIPVANILMVLNNL